MKDSRVGMKVCLLTETFPPEVNGVSFTLARLAKGLSELGDEVQVLRPKRAYMGSGDEPWQEIDLPSCPIPNYPQLRFGLPCAGRLEELWKKERMKNHISPSLPGESSGGKFTIISLKQKKQNFKKSVDI